MNGERIFPSKWISHQDLWSEDWWCIKIEVLIILCRRYSTTSTAMWEYMITLISSSHLKFPLELDSGGWNSTQIIFLYFILLRHIGACSEYIWINATILNEKSFRFLFYFVLCIYFYPGDIPVISKK
jgi:hypothetical protein